jgi:hypothetical protein
MTPFTTVPTRAFVRVDGGNGEFWFGTPLLFATARDRGGKQYEVVYCKWLGHELRGRERLSMPLPATFALHQWAKTYMGMPPLHGATGMHGMQLTATALSVPVAY